MSFYLRPACSDFNFSIFLKIFANIVRTLWDNHKYILEIIHKSVVWKIIYRLSLRHRFSSNLSTSNSLLHEVQDDSSHFSIGLSAGTHAPFFLYLVYVISQTKKHQKETRFTVYSAEKCHLNLNIESNIKIEVLQRRFREVQESDAEISSVFDTLLIRFLTCEIIYAQKN